MQTFLAWTFHVISPITLDTLGSLVATAVILIKPSGVNEVLKSKVKNAYRLRTCIILQHFKEARH